MRLGPIVIACLFATWVAPPLRAEQPLDFARDVRPILNEHCLPCHGPDREQREADLRLDELHNAFHPRGDRGSAIVPRDPEASLLVQRITAQDPSERMPPEDFERPLSQDQIATLKNWIAAGAPWPRHWSYQPVCRPPVPVAAIDDWCRSAIDGLALAAMRAHGLSPSPEAPREMLIRRVTLDLTGLPPTPDEVRAFVEDGSPDAYERLVNRLLASPRYGERMATAWLDAARYADTHGYHADSHRDMWLWRAWVIKALNDNKPFDEFTVEQLAGDLLPNATDAQRLATGFHRNTMLNAEEGAIAEEYLTEYVADRVETTATVWLAQTLQCARCHDHKYEPYTQRDYYRMFAYFHNVSEKGLDGRKGNAEPLMWMPAPEQQRQLDQLRHRSLELETQMNVRRKQAIESRETWEAQLAAERVAAPPDDALWYVALNETEGNQAHGADAQAVLNIQGDAQWITSGKFDRALLLNGSTRLDAIGDAWSIDNGFSLSLWVFPTTHDRMRLAACGKPMGSVQHWQLLLHEGHLVAQVLFDGQETPWLLASEQKLALRRWQNVVFTCAASGSSQPVQLSIDGTPVTRRDVEQPQSLPEIIGQPFHLGAADENGFRGLLDEVRFFARMLNTTETALLAGADPIGEILRLPLEHRSRQQTAQLLNYYLENVDPEYRQLKRSHDELDRGRREIMLNIPTTMIMDEMDPPRPTFILERGNYQFPQQQVAPGTPEVLPSLAADAPSNRLTLARWLVDRQNPLTARVIVNRMWQLHFGTGLVSTPDDFGVRGATPSHPELLDWLAAEFMDSGWDVKQMHRLIVLSATYRQTSECGRERYAADPENRWLARGARQRLAAEHIRDSALAASGLLQERIGGPSVFPYQPPGLWEELAYNQDQYTAQRYLQSHGADLYRRSVYSFWKRASPPPAMTAFDAPNRERCIVMRNPSNTAVQALVLMNDPTFVEAARHLAQRVLLEAEPGFERQLDYCYRLVYSRAPQPREVQLMQSVYERVHSKFSGQNQNAGAATQLLSVGESGRDQQLNAADVAAWSILAQILINTDEAITRP